MTLFLCKLWPYLAGGLIGWLLAGWFARRLKHSEAPVETVVEKEVVKVVDNPEHVALIGKLEGENSKISALMATISDYESSDMRVIEKEVEKIVEIDNPVLLARIKKLEEENSRISGLQNQIKDLESSRSTETTEVQKIVDNPKHIQRISSLEDELSALKKGPTIDLKAARSAGIAIRSENDLTAIEGIGPKINDLIQADGIKTFYALADTNPATIQKILDNAGSRFKMANPGTWPDQANLAANNRWPALKALQDVLIGGVYPDGASVSSESKADKAKDTALSGHKKPDSVSSTTLDIDAAKAAGFKVKPKTGEDDFTVIEGIGPKINGLIHTAGIHTYLELSETLVEDIQKILDDAGSRYKLAKPGTWPAQSEMAATNRWDTLKAWQNELDGGK